MTVICISRGSYSRGAEVAERTAARLGYRCLARDLIIEASEEFNIPEIKLLQAVEDPPSVLDRVRGGKARYVAYLRAAVLRHFCDDDLVYHGLAGHFFVPGITHVLKLRILADLEDRAGIVVAETGVTEKEALARLARADRGRRRWALHLYGLDPEDSSLYDTVVHVGQMGIDGAVDVICGLVEQGAFRTTAQSQAAMVDLSLAASIEAQLVDMQPNQPVPEVTACDGLVTIRVKPPARVRAGSFGDFQAHYLADLQTRLYGRTRGLPGLRGLDVKLVER